MVVTGTPLPKGKSWLSHMESQNSNCSHVAHELVTVALLKMLNIDVERIVTD